MDKTKSVAQSLRHARHDFLNELQLISMYLDLGKPEKAQAIIRAHAEAAVQLSHLSALHMPQLEEWLLVSKWRFPEIRFVLEVTARTGEPELDGAIARTLEAFFQRIRADLDPYVEYVCTISIFGEGPGFSTELSLNGDWACLEFPEESAINATKACEGDGAKWTIRAQMEG
jgi:stage 0 sporulation protein B (sporulation initiation phosphotransferase)